MKRQALIRELTAAGCVLQRHGKRHDIYRNPANGRQAPVPRIPQTRGGVRLDGTAKAPRRTRFGLGGQALTPTPISSIMLPPMILRISSSGSPLSSST